MHFSTHSELVGQHAFLSPSNYHWVNYDLPRLETRFASYSAARRGTELHDFAHEAIRLGVKIARSHGTLASYVADGIRYQMVCEQPLYYSPNCFGHADTISFRRRKLRIHDLKTGVTKASFTQLEVYAAIFCLEYGTSPFDIDIELRIYQGDDVAIFVPNAEAIQDIMDRIVEFDAHIDYLKADS
jgi:hypothetical protein